MRDLSKANLIKKMTENEEIPLKIIHMNVNEDDSVVVAFEKILDESKRIDPSNLLMTCSLPTYYCTLVQQYVSPIQ